MSVGIVPSKNELDNLSGGLARDLNILLTRIQQLKSYLDTQTDAALTATYGYTSAELASLRSAYSDLDQLRAIFQGTATLATAKDFRTFAKSLWGTGVM